jgi:hypothetical protein
MLYTSIVVPTRRLAIAYSDRLVLGGWWCFGLPVACLMFELVE